ncbi:GTP cyclohydrolase II [Rhodococcus sp. NM-2]|uniref:GTP cyclohydrolase II n=1 Tax=Rhodococcus sp. NM-2 TaxID=3401174 RepID=UPI003AAFF0FB
MNQNSRVDAAVAAIREGGIVVVADSAARENEGDLIMSADRMSADKMAFFLRHGSGIVCVPMNDARAEELALPHMVTHNTDEHQTAFTVSVDHMSVGTGISAEDRATTVRSLADSATSPEHLHRPGHIFPLRARPGGVLERAGHTEAATDLLALAGRTSVAAITELVDRNGVPISGVRLLAFARRHRLPFLEIDDLVCYRRRIGKLIDRGATADLPIGGTVFRATTFHSVLDGVEHIAFTLGDVRTASSRADGILVRVHSECLTGDVFGSLRCDCGPQLHQALDLIAAEGSGVVVYLRGHEGRGIGLAHKLRAYALQDSGLDTVDANTELGLPVDGREYGVGAEILADLGVSRMRLITNNPHKYHGLTGYELTIVDRISLAPSVNPHNIAYLRTKQQRLGHTLKLPPDKRHRAQPREINVHIESDVV